LPEIVQDVSSQPGTKWAHETDEEELEDDSDDEDAEIVVSKAPKLEKKSTRPKAADYDEFGKELVLNAANKYRALLASQGAFPDSSRELKLVKKAWKMVNAESGVIRNPLGLTPSIVTIVSKFKLFYLFIDVVCASRLKVEGRNFGAKRKQKRRHLWRLYMVLIVVGANGR
jgi:hypothetical protein